MSDALGANHDIDADRVAAPHRGLHPIERGGDGRRASALDPDAGVILASASSPTAKVVASSCWPTAPFLMRRAKGALAGESAKISTVSAPLVRKSSVAFNCAASSLAVGSAVLAPGKRWE